jgi:hypothetical protein
MPIIQPLGTNKLADSVFEIAFMLGQNRSSGYPLGDPEVVQFLKADLNLGTALQRASKMCFLRTAIIIGMTPEYSEYGGADILKLM